MNQSKSPRSKVTVPSTQFRSGVRRGVGCVARAEPLERRLLLAGEPELVKDLNTAPLSSHPQQLVDVSGTLFFSAENRVHGRELWKSDGTEAGTVLVKDVRPGTGSSYPSTLTNVNGTLFFTADDGSGGRELWKSDGTNAGTVRVKDINPGTTAYGYALSSVPSHLTNVSGKLFFTADDGSGGVELWKSDGTEAGTVLVKDIRSGASYGSPLSSSPGNLTNVNGTLFFTADDGSSGAELWKSDGTEAGTVLVKDVRSGATYGSPLSSSPGNLTSVNGTLFFTADDGSDGVELWKSDGTEAGTVLVKDIHPGSSYSYADFVPNSSSPSDLTNVNGTLFFTANDGGGGIELWKSDGTDAGTMRIRDINPGSGGSSASNLAAADEILFFTAIEPSGGTELWKSDGTEAGTVRVTDINPGPARSGPSNLRSVGETLFFSADDGSGGRELWKSDGTETGTVLVKDINPGAASYGPFSTSFYYLTDVNGTLFFSASDPAGDIELWKGDGTDAGTLRVKDINGTEGSSPTNLTPLNGTFFFTADSKLWKSDGTEAGTTLIRDIAPSNLTDVDGTLFFTADDGATGTELWKSDGTQGGTIVVRDIYPGSSTVYRERCDYYGCYEVPYTEPNSSSPSSLINVDGTLFFSADDGSGGRELWKSDGTKTGTVLVKDINPGTHGYGYGYQYPNSSSPSNLININGTLFFTAEDGGGVELWKSDGTEPGTVLVKDIAPGSSYDGIPLSSSPEKLINVNGILFFSAADGNGQRELWKSDGTESGTVLVRDINPGTGSSSPSNLTHVSGTLFFSADDGSGGTELWKSDGTEAGTIQVRDINPGVGGSDPANLIDLKGTLFFSANDGMNGVELWRSDGTPAGTVMVKEITPDDSGGSLGGFTDVNGTLYFVSTHESQGSTLWRTDGTAEGTVLVAELSPPGLAVSNPPSITNVDGTLFFAADEGFHGLELWKLADAGPEAVSITGTEGDDTIELTITDSVLRVEVNGALQTFEAAKISRIEISALGGNDLIDWSDISIPTLIDAGLGDDTITAGSGDDTIDAGAGEDNVFGNDGNDKIAGGDGADTLRGGAQRDTIEGGIGPDLLSAGGGNDKLVGGGGHDRLYGGDGDDNIFGAGGADRLHGGGGSDILHGGDGPDLLSGGGGKDRLFGQGGRDRLYGGDGDDQLDGGSWDDRIYGHAGNDKLFGGLGTDLLDGGEGNDLALRDDKDTVENLEDVMQ